MCQGLVELALIPECDAQVVVRVDVLRPESQRLLVTCHRFVKLSQAQQRIAQVVVRFGEVGPNRKNLAISNGRLGEPPRTMFTLCQGNEGLELGCALCASG